MGGKNSKPTTNELVYALPRGNPTESVDMPLAKMEKYDLKTATATRVTVQPGWSWAQHVGDGSEGASCDVRRVGYCEKGQLNVTMADGTKKKVKAGDCYLVEPGHTAKNKGKVPFVGVEFVTKMNDETRGEGGGTVYAADASGESGDEKKQIDTKNFAAPTKAMKMPKGNACVCILGNNQAKTMKARLQPGWTWKTGARMLLPPEKQDLEACPARHVGMVTEGKFEMIDGEGNAALVTPGMCYVCEPGHDAKVVGDRPVQLVEFESVM